jgi:nucleotide-binding universal stress UspA family protein
VIVIDRILCPVDFSEFSRHALEYAVAMATYYDARVTALHVYADLPVVTAAPSLGIEGLQPVSLVEIDRAAVVAATERFAALVPGDGRVDPMVQEAPHPVDEILAQADLLGAGLIVVGSHGRSGFERLLLGSVAGKVLRRSARPVMVVPPHTTAGPPPMPFRRLLCPIDFSDSSLRALEFALHLAQEARARLTLLHAIEIPPELHEIPLAMDINVANVRSAANTELFRRLQAMVPASARDYCAIDTCVVEGKAHREILRVASDERTDLVVMGVQGRGAVDLALFGSNTLAVVHGASCPVLTVRA